MKEILHEDKFGEDLNNAMTKAGSKKNKEI